MTEFLAEYGLFLLKTVTIVVAIVVIIGSAAAASKKASHQEGLEVEDLNKKTGGNFEEFQKLVSAGEIDVNPKVKEFLDNLRDGIGELSTEDVVRGLGILEQEYNKHYGSTEKQIEILSFFVETLAKKAPEALAIWEDALRQYNASKEIRTAQETFG